MPSELRRETWASLPLSTVLPELPLVTRSQALDGAFTEENRAQCRAATAPLLEAVDNLSAFASNPEFSSVPAQISPEVRQGASMDCRPPLLLSRSLETHPSASPSPGPGCHGAQCDLCQDNVGECGGPHSDGPSPGRQSAGPTTLVRAGWPLPYCLGLHQEADYKHEVGGRVENLVLGDAHLSDRTVEWALWCGEMGQFWRASVAQDSGVQGKVGQPCAQEVHLVLESVIRLQGQGSRAVGV